MTFLVGSGLVFCGERACPALGGEAALKPVTPLCLNDRGAVLGLLRTPTWGKPTRHN